ncbi:50S ribosomal protein L3 [Miniphocaeibacter halophilus]|uniref:50S ribosomal protein L3 n=1 Tax=Miniphocaeibacter halophilus TaxID=2931922 RepID=A0AC61MPI3_9FIRM|nr:50S ribosomal protein L3 [Miniphocaeibacter halophilus]QQK07048.1 50S ribosomal protein L3 [Miniphocaeibacter halophilus]
MKSILGKKVGMTQIFLEDGELIPVTVIEAGPMIVTQVKSEETDGYNAIQVGYIDKKESKVNKPMKGHFDKAGVGYKKHLQEFPLNEGESYEVGAEIKVDIFEENDKVDVFGTSKGKGTQGSIVRHNYGRGPETHGSKSHRVAGARSAGTYPGRVFKGTKGSGKTGNERVTIQNLTIVRVDADKNLILVKGAIPGPKGGIVTIKESVKA